MNDQLKSPCIGCEFETEDKNNSTCRDCDLRCQYVSAMGNMSSSLPDGQMEAVKEEEEKVQCNMCLKIKTADQFDFVNDGTRKRKTCRKCYGRYFDKQKPIPRSPTMEREVIYLFAPFADSKVLKNGTYPSFQAYTGDEFHAALNNGDLGGEGEVLEVELVRRHEIKQTVAYSLEESTE